MFVTHKALNSKNTSTDLFQWREDRKLRQLVAEEAEAGADMVLTSYGCPLAAVPYFKYLVRIMSASENYWRQWYIISVISGVSGCSCRGYWEERVQMLMRWRCFMSRWFRRYLFTGQRRGLCPHVLVRHWVDSNIRRLAY